MSPLPSPVEAYLDRFSELNDPPALRRLVREKWLVRHRFGQKPDRSEYRSRFPTLFVVDVADETILPTYQAERSDPDATDPYTADDSPARFPKIPGHELMHLLGRGGMGTDYLARQQRLGRFVAVKVIRGGSAGPDELARFQAEAEAVARLQHPNVVQVFETGEWEPDPGAPGLPFFTMEYVPGGSLADQLKGRPWAAADAARLTETLARAIHAAHLQGIVHRDLKPGNILIQGSGVNSQETVVDPENVTPDSRLLIPKVSDFGLAKNLEQDSGQTRTGDIVGTPSYMAPEQAAGKTKSIGPPADVRALGAVLYEMLTGRPPFRGETGWDTLQQVLLEEPVPPRRLVPRLPRDLETITLKCLEKDAERRYAQADLLADDLRRFQAGEPITACPVGFTGRAWKWAKRRPTAAGLLALSALIPVGLLVVGIWYTDRLRWEKQQETLRAEESERERKATERERDRAEENLDLAFDGMTRMVARARDTRVIGTPQGEEAVRGLLEDAVEFCQKFLLQKGDSPKFRRNAAMAHRLLGDARRHMGQPKLAESSYGTAIDLHEHLVADMPSETIYQLDLPGSLLNRAHLRSELNRPADAEADYRRTVQVRRQLTESHPNQPTLKRELAIALFNLGAFLSEQRKYDQVEEPYKAAQEILILLLADQPVDTDTQAAYAACSTNFGLACWHRQQWATAEMHLKAATDMQRRLVAANSHDPMHRYRLANTLNTLGLVQLGAGRSNDAEARFKEAVAFQQQLAADHPSVPAYHSELAISLHNLADRVWDRENSIEARRLLDLAIRHQQLARRSNPVHQEYRMWLANHYALQGDVALSVGDHAKAAESATGLATTGVKMEDAFDAAGQLAQCVALVAKDASLTPEQKQKKADEYTEQSVKLTREAFVRGYKDADGLMKNTNFAPLQERADFRKLVAEIRAKK